MTFVKPSTVLNATGAYGYKKSLASSNLNYIDNNFPNVLDKTGDTITGIITLSGSSRLTTTSGSNITLVSGVSLNSNTGSTLTLNGSVTAGGSSTVSLAGATTLPSGSTLTAQLGSTINFNSGSGFNMNGNMTIASSGSLLLNGLTTQNVTTVTANYTFDTGGVVDYMVLANYIGTAITVTLPAAATKGRICIVKDGNGSAASHTIAINRNGNLIDGLTSTLNINTLSGC